MEKKENMLITLGTVILLLLIFTQSQIYNLKMENEEFKNFKSILNYINKEAPLVINKNVKKSYIKRYFYTQAGYYKGAFDYKSQRYLYELTHNIVKSVA